MKTRVYKHTPPPWIMNKKSNYANIVYGQSGRQTFYRDDGFRSVATYSPCDKHAEDADVNQEANGRLIKSAPELLDMVETMLKWAELLRAAGVGSFIKEEVEKAEALLDYIAETP